MRSAKFSKRHYIVVADVLATEYRQAANPSKELGAIYRIAYTLADKFAADNSRFSTEHFLAVVRGEKGLNSRPSRPAEPTMYETPGCSCAERSSYTPEHDSACPARKAVRQ